MIDSWWTQPVYVCRCEGEGECRDCEAVEAELEQREVAGDDGGDE